MAKKPQAAPTSDPKFTAYADEYFRLVADAAAAEAGLKYFRTKREDATPEEWWALIDTVPSAADLAHARRATQIDVPERLVTLCRAIIGWLDKVAEWDIFLNDLPLEEIERFNLGSYNATGILRGLGPNACH